MIQNIARIRPPKDESDSDGAIRVFHEFLQQYQATLVSADHYFDEMLEQVQAPYAQAYRPWQHAVKDLLHGVYLVAKKIPLKNPRALADALRLFTLESAVGMLQDVCISCKLKIPQNWAQIFAENMRALSQAFRILVHQHVLSLAR